jgi:hypothetical protein
MKKEKRPMFKQAICAAVLGITLVGCDYDGKAEARKAELDQMWAGKAKPTYTEFQNGNRIYVVGSEKSREKVISGGKLGQHVIAFGAGPNGETVVFEQDKNRMEDILMAEYASRHGVKVQ